MRVWRQEVRLPHPRLVWARSVLLFVPGDIEAGIMAEFNCCLPGQAFYCAPFPCSLLSLVCF